MDLSKCFRHAFSMRLFVLSLFFILTLWSSQASAKCNSVRVFNGDVLIEDGVCLKEYKTEDCLPFAESHKVSLLPEDGMRGDSVESPKRLDVLATMTSFPGQDEDYHYPGLQLSWTSPNSGSAKKSIRGFYLWIQSDDNNQTECRIFTVDHSKYTQYQLQFEYDLERISETTGRNYTVRIFSLPFPDRQTPITDWIHDKYNYKTKLVTTKNPFSTTSSEDQYPGHWSAGITVGTDAEDRSIDVWFSLPDPSLNYGFTNYSVGLVNVAIDLNNPIREEPVYIAPGSNATRGHHRFTDLSLAGWYEVYVRVIDLYGDDGKNCQCYYKEKTFVGMVTQCLNTCPFSYSAVFDLNGDVTLDPTIGTHEPPPTTKEVTSSGTNSTSSSTGSTSKSDSELIIIIVAAVVGVGVVVGLILLAVFKFFPMYRLSSPEIPKDGESLKIVSVVKKSLNLRQRKVFLWYSTDHQHHLEMIKQFKIFLQTHCKTLVEDMSEFDVCQQNGGTAMWLSNKFSQCDFILFFDSPGAYHRLKNFTTKKYYAKEFGPHGDFFNLGLQYICSEVIEKNLSNKAMIVSLTEERCKQLCLGVLKEWVLPRDLSLFLQQLHGLKSDSINDFKSQLPMMHEFRPELPHVPDLLQAIKDVTKFEEQNPDWFSTHFELAEKPSLERIVSNDDSNYGSWTGSINRSVTPTFGSSNNSSPTSDNLDLPDFPNDDDNDEGIDTPTDAPTTDPPRLMESYAKSGYDFKFSSGKNEKNYLSSVNKPQLVPPIDKSKISSDETSIAIGGFNSIMSQSDVDRTSDAPEEVVPPCNKSQIVTDNLSMAIGCLNQNVNQNTSGALTTKNVITPPIELSDLDFENFSLALGNSNLNNVTSSHLESDDHQRYLQNEIKPPTDSGYLDDGSDGFSKALLNNNSHFTNSNTHLSAVEKVTNVNSQTVDKERNDSIRPPVNAIPVEKLDNFSEVLNYDINRNKLSLSPSVAEDRKEKFTEQGRQKLQSPIHPPESDVPCDNFSCALQDMNTISNGSNHARNEKFV